MTLNGSIMARLLLSTIVRAMVFRDKGGIGIC